MLCVTSRAAPSRYAVSVFATRLHRQGQYRVGLLQCRPDRTRRYGTGHEKALMGMVTTDQPHKTSIQQLLSQISFATLTDTQGPVHARLVLLLTSAFAQNAQTPDGVLDILKHLRIGHDTEQQVDVVTAVVDSLPAFNGSQIGRQGLSYLVETISETAMKFSTHETPLDKSIDVPGSLTVQLDTPLGAYHLQLPLAHTVFTTGMPSTLRLDRYRSNATSNKITESQELESISVYGGSVQEVSIDLPLMPLTPARAVTSSMGNIVRNLSSVELFKSMSNHIKSSQEIGSQPASQELETAVQRYFEALDVAPHAMSVWALISPRKQPLPQELQDLEELNAASLPQLWRSQDKSQLRKRLGVGIHKVLKSGGRLCRVLSGGGGWGKKAGLLSFDPDTAYSTRHLRKDLGWKFDFDSSPDTDEAADQQKRQAMGEIVKEGESVMFFAFAGDEQSSWSHAAMADYTNTSTFAFGAIPSTVDAIPEEGSDDASSEPNITHDVKVFGALSEGGLAMSFRPRTDHGWKPDQTPAQSKLDVPFGIFLGQDRK